MQYTCINQSVIFKVAEVIKATTRCTRSVRGILFYECS